MSYIINIHAHVEDLLDLVGLLDALRHTDESTIHITTDHHDESEADEVEQVLSHMEPPTPSQAVLDEIERLRNRSDHPTNHKVSPGLWEADIRIDALETRVDELQGLKASQAELNDYASRFRGLLADFEGASTQILELQARINGLESWVVAQIPEPPL